MSEPASTNEFFDELELRQTDLLRRLDALNNQVEQTLREQLSRRENAEANPHH